jgi:hypothetical protein
LNEQPEDMSIVKFTESNEVPIPLRGPVKLAWHGVPKRAKRANIRRAHCALACIFNNTTCVFALVSLH